MIRNRNRNSVVFASALLAALACSSTALAQGGTGGMGLSLDDSKEAADVRPPAPGEPAPPSTGLLYVSLFLLGGLAFGLAVMPSRRTHTD